MSVKLPQIMGHRGAPSLAPENTLLGFKTAFQAGALWTETDVSLLGDGTPVIFHDATMDRCTDRSGSIAALSLDDLQRVNANQQHPAAVAVAAAAATTLKGLIRPLHFNKQETTTARLNSGSVTFR